MTQKKAPAKKAAAKKAAPAKTAPTKKAADAEKIVVTPGDDTNVEHTGDKAAKATGVGSSETGARAGYVAGLETELEFLKRQPNPNAQRIAGVKAELDRYAGKPSQRRTETA